MQTTIPVNTKISGIIDTATSIPHMLYMPDNITSTTATFIVAETLGGVFRRLGDAAGNAYGVTFAAGDAVPLDPSIFASVRFLQLVVGSTESGSDKIVGIGLIPR